MKAIALSYKIVVDMSDFIRFDFLISDRLLVKTAKEKTLPFDVWKPERE